MEWSFSGNALKTFACSITCVRLGSDDIFTEKVQRAVEVLRTPIGSIDHLSVLLPNLDASKVQWTLDCNNGMRKAYWITCNVEPDIQHLSLNRRRLPSSFVVRPRDLNRLLANFQTTLQEITIIATEATSLPSDSASEIGAKAVELRSYIDPSKASGFSIVNNDSSLHTQLWIYPSEEFVQYNHAGDPVDVTFGVKELKAFVSLCGGCEVDIHLNFEKAGEPILMAPKFGLDNGSASNFDATLVLATMLLSQLHAGHSAEPQPTDVPMHRQADHGKGAQGQGGPRVNISEHPSDHTRIWSEISGSAARSGSGTGERQVQGKRNSNNNEQRDIGRVNELHISEARRARVPVLVGPHPHTMETDRAEEPQDRAENNGHGFSQRHPSNWVDADEDDDEGEEADLCVHSTPPYYEER
ncbi:hypothetical protein LguiA_013062 [Lonicera macranthoides]